MNNNSVKYVFLILWLGLLAYLISLMLEICKSDNEESSENPTTSANSETTTTSNERMNNTFDYTENFEPNDPKDIGNQAASKNEVSQQEISFDPPVDNSEVLVQNVTQEDEDEIAVEGTDALIAASSNSGDCGIAGSSPRGKSGVVLVRLVLLLAALIADAILMASPFLLRC